MVAYSIAQYGILRRRLAEAAPLQGEIYLTDRISSPFVMGIFHPRIYLPSSTPMEERRFIVAHERHHIRRGDPVWKLLGYAALCILFVNIMSLGVLSAAITNASGSAWANTAAALRFASIRTFSFGFPLPCTFFQSGYLLSSQHLLTSFIL